MTRNFRFMVHGITKKKKEDLLVLRYFDTEGDAVGELVEFANNADLVDSLFEYKTVRLQIDEAVNNKFETIRVEVCTPAKRTKCSKH